MSNHGHPNTIQFNFVETPQIVLSKVSEDGTGCSHSQLVNIIAIATMPEFSLQNGNLFCF